MEGRVALVTGGSRGIGRAIAEKLGERGARLAISSREPEQAADELNAAGLEALPLQADLSRGEAAERLVEDTLAHFGQLDVMVYAAGLNIRRPALEMTAEEWRAVQQVNVDGAFLTARAAARPMLERGWGRLLFIASLTSFNGGFKMPITAYAASKSAILGLTRGLATEWASGGVRVNALAPGFVRTEFTAPIHGDETLHEEIRGRIPVGRWAEPEDMAGAGAFLCSPEAEYVTGQVLIADGGFLAY